MHKNRRFHMPQTQGPGFGSSSLAAAPQPKATTLFERLHCTCKISCAVAWLAAVQTLHAQSGVVVLQIQITAPTCAITWDQALAQSGINVQLNQSCGLVPAAPQGTGQAQGIARVQLPPKTTPTLAQQVVQITYQ